MKEYAMEKDVQGIVDLASAYYGSAVLFAAIDCGVFVQIEEGRFDASAKGPRLLADACVALGLLSKGADGTYSNTAAGRLALVPGAPADLTKAICYNRDVYPAWGKLAQFVRTSHPVENPALHLGDDSSRTGAFADAMYSRAMGIGRGVIPMLGAIDGRVLDLAGGPAAYAILMCKANPRLSVVTVDLPAISKFAEKNVADEGLSGRIECRSGDYRSDEYESGAYDAVTIFGALHQESPEDIRASLGRATRALRPGGKIFILDMMTDATDRKSVV